MFHPVEQTWRQPVQLPRQTDKLHTKLSHRNSSPIHCRNANQLRFKFHNKHFSWRDRKQLLANLFQPRE